jgi:hypothetical protein
VKTPSKQPVGIEKIQVAVSDAGNNEPHPFVWKWANPEEEKKITAQAQKMATEALSAYAKKYNQPAPGTLQDIQLHAYDLAYNNEADVILTAKATPAAEPVRPHTKTTVSRSAETSSAKKSVDFYVTVVGREDIYGQLQPIFASVTDNQHLDAFPKLQLIDAVDADGNGRGDLLFRSTGDSGSSFVLYKVTAGQMTELISVPEPKT